MNVLEEQSVSFVVVPGWHNSGPQHWQTLWERELQNCSRVQQRDWENPLPHEWVAALNDAVAACRGPVVLLAHSLGCHTVARWATTHDNRVQAALLVAPPAPQARNPCSHIVSRFDAMGARLPFPSLLVGSDNDPYATPEEAKQLASRWGCEFVNAGRVGHINTDSGHGPWPQGKELLHGLLFARCFTSR